MIAETKAAPHADLLERFRAGQRTALARAISIVEDGRPGFERLLHELHGDMGRAHRVGVTGPPRAGKSTLTSQLAPQCRPSQDGMGIVGGEPSAPFPAAAPPGARLRLHNIATAPGVFIRSMASRGRLGGLANTTKE